MNFSLVASLFKSILIGLLVITFQNISAVYIHEWILLPDIITITIFLFLFHSDPYFTKWVFVVSFSLGIIQSVWAVDVLGVASMYYLFLALFHTIYANLVGSNLQLFVFVTLSMIFKGILFTLLAFVFNIKGVLSFVYSMEYVYQFVGTLAVTVTIGFIINTLLLNSIKD